MSDFVIIGAGNMGQALAEGLTRNPVNQIYFKTKSSSPVDLDNQQDRIISSHSFDDFKNLDRPIIICAVKPAMMLIVLSESLPYFKKINPRMIISVAAGVSLSDLSSAVENRFPLVRSMPNTPVAYGKGVVGYYTQDDHIIPDFEMIFKDLGMIVCLKHEADFNLLTAMAGSGPAYIFHMVEALSQAAIRLGMEKHMADTLAYQVMIGSADLLNGHDPAKLRQNVTSPNGTTWAGLQKLINPELDLKYSRLADLLEETLLAAKKRCEKLNTAS